MSDPRKHPDSSPEETSDAPSSTDVIFSAPSDPPARRGLFVAVVLIATLALVAAVLFSRGHRSTGSPVGSKAANTPLPADPAAKSLVFSQLAMSQSTSISGGTSTFLDGRIRNSGTSTLAAATVQVIFRNDVGLSPQVDSLPLSLIRTRQPYVDTEPVSAEPLKPGQEAEFRLIFEAIPENWNQEMPELQVVRAKFQ